MRKLIEPSAGVADALRLERIADAIVSIEYYMETLQNGRADPWYMLDNAETCLVRSRGRRAPRAAGSPRGGALVRADVGEDYQGRLDRGHGASRGSPPRAQAATNR